MVSEDRPRSEEALAVGGKQALCDFTHFTALEDTSASRSISHTVATSAYGRPLPTTLVFDQPGLNLGAAAGGTIEAAESDGLAVSFDYRMCSSIARSSKKMQYRAIGIGRPISVPIR